jgi:hypothetical protein
MLSRSSAQASTCKYIRRKTQNFYNNILLNVRPKFIIPNSVAQEPEGSSPHSQQPATGPYPESVESNPLPPANLPKRHSDPIFPPTPWSSDRSLSFGLSPPKPCRIFFPLTWVQHAPPTSFALI